ncbi:MAG: DHH family phosphoesterase [Porticoccaceae bacterium]|nr:DHH family phosphoesterase [Porticoccaceae bacterium]
MADYDVFNGDADGICALLQLRFAEPREAQLVTGVKREIDLLNRVYPAADDRITVLDISLDKNREGLNRALDVGAQVFYVDHHFAGAVPASASLKSLINEAPDVCTSVLIDHYLRGAYREWAVVGTFGDNLKHTANGLIKNLYFSAEQVTLLENLGIYINYNGYGANLEELHFAPDQLYRLLSQYRSPFDFVADNSADFQKLEQGYHQDIEAAQSTVALVASDEIAAFVLPNEPWARRVSGVFSNQLANDNPQRGHAVLTVKPNGNYLVSVRAPLNNKKGAAALCMQFPTGGGREAAAGINDLPADMLAKFLDQLKKAFSF